jgi:hypothetical protein
MTAEELDGIFDAGEEDILPYLDLSKAARPGKARRPIPARPARNAGD